MLGLSHHLPALIEVMLVLEHVVLDADTHRVVVTDHVPELALGHDGFLLGTSHDLQDAYRVVARRWGLDGVHVDWSTEGYGALDVVLRAFLLIVCMAAELILRCTPPGAAHALSVGVVGHHLAKLGSDDLLELGENLLNGNSKLPLELTLCVGRVSPLSELLEANEEGRSFLDGDLRAELIERIATHTSSVRTK